MTYHWQTCDFGSLSTLELYAALRLRQQIFVLEQNCLYLDLDNLDQVAIHIMCWRDGQLLAYLRCLAPGASFAESAIGRIVVAPEARGRDLGRELVRRGVSYNLQRWPDTNIRINAQSYLEDFYCNLGFAVAGAQYLEDGIPHIQMLYSRPS